MPDYQKLYMELYCAVNEALQHLVQGNQADAVVCLLNGQVETVKEILK